MTFAQAVKRRDAKSIGRFYNYFRFERGLSYRDLFELAHRHDPTLDQADWDALLRDSDDIEANAWGPPPPWQSR